MRATSAASSSVWLCVVLAVCLWMEFEHNCTHVHLASFRCKKSAGGSTARYIGRWIVCMCLCDILSVCGWNLNIAASM